MAVKNTNTFDLVVLGGGPSGSTLASLVAKRGWKVLVLEKERFPRHQIGESLLPSTLHGILEITGAKKKVLKAGFYKKYGGTFLWGNSNVPWTFNFLWTKDAPTYALQVDRAVFDKILLDHAKTLGVKARAGCQATKLLRHEGRVNGVEYIDSHGNKKTVHARFVADASGSNSTFFSAAGERIYASTLRNVSAYAYYRGGKRLPGKARGNMLTVTFPGGWFWYIPISETVTSVGLISTAEAFAGNKIDQAFFARNLRECPLIAQFLSGAKMITTGKFGKIRVRKDWSYCNTSFSSPGFCVVGDSACFVDPVFSTGVHLGTIGALQAARAINSSLEDPAHEELFFREFERKYKVEYGTVYQFVCGFYSSHGDRDSYFWSAKSILKTEEQPHLAFSRLVSGSVCPSEIYSKKIHRSFPQALEERLSGNLWASLTDGQGESDPGKKFLEEKWFRRELDRPDEQSEVTLSDDFLGWRRAEAPLPKARRRAERPPTLDSAL